MMPGAPDFGNEWQQHDETPVLRTAVNIETQHTRLKNWYGGPQTASRAMVVLIHAQ